MRKSSDGRILPGYYWSQYEEQRREWFTDIDESLDRGPKSATARDRVTVDTAYDLEEHAAMLDTFKDAPKFICPPGGLVFEPDMDRSKYASQIQVLPFDHVVLEVEGLCVPFDDFTVAGLRGNGVSPAKQEQCSMVNMVPKWLVMVSQYDTKAWMEEMAAHPGEYPLSTQPEVQGAIDGLRDYMAGCERVFIVRSAFINPHNGLWALNYYASYVRSQPRFIDNLQEAIMHGKLNGDETEGKTPRWRGFSGNPLMFPRRVVENRTSGILHESIDSESPRAREAALSLARIVNEQALSIFTDFMLIMNTTNREIHEVPAPKFTNAKRKKKGRPPLSTYSVIQVPEVRADTPVRPENRVKGALPTGRKHASPRFHMRRQHLRKLYDRSGALDEHGERVVRAIVAVKAATIGDKSNGQVQQGYVVSKGRKSKGKELST